MNVLKSRKGRAMLIGVLIGVVGLLLGAGDVVTSDTVRVKFVVMSGWIILVSILSFIFGTAIEDAAEKANKWLENAGVEIGFSDLGGVIDSITDAIITFLVDDVLDDQISDEQQEKLKNWLKENLAGKLVDLLEEMSTPEPA